MKNNSDKIKEDPLTGTEITFMEWGQSRVLSNLGGDGILFQVCQEDPWIVPTFYTCDIVKHIKSLGILEKVSVVGYP